MLRKATRQKAKIRLGISAVSGGGKTYSAILVAKGLAKGDLSKVAIIDTENGSADLYSHLGEYNVYPLQAPFSPERYISAIKECETAGMEVIIIDSITHEWDGKGGILEISNSMTGNSYTNWAKLTPRHQAFIDAILQSSCHIITTVRRKQDYEMTTNSQGKLVPQKVGLKEVTREGFEYELTVNLELDIKHNATASKDRTGLFMGKPDFVPNEETGKAILEWCESGTQPLAPVYPKDTDRKNGLSKPPAQISDEQQEVIDLWADKIAGCNSLAELKKVFDEGKAIINNDPTLFALKESKKTALQSLQPA